MALANGVAKYGEANWRALGAKFKMSTYISAILRHVVAIREGEDVAPDSGVSHVGHIMANCAILLDAQKAGTLHDDRILLP